MCFLKKICESHHNPRNFVDSSTGRGVFPILTVGGLWILTRGAVKCMTLHFWAANLKPFLVAHSCMEFTACCKCLSMVSRERPRKQIDRSSTNSALKMSLAMQEGSSLIFSPKTGHSQDTTSWNTLLWVEFVRKCGPNFDSDSAVPEIFWDKNRQSASEANPVKVSNDTILPGCLVGLLQVKEDTDCLLLYASRRYLSRLTRWSVVLRCFLKPHWLLSSIPDFSRYQMRPMLIIRSNTLHRQLVGSVWSLFGLGIGITVAALHWWGKSAEVHILFRISFRILSVSSGRCYNRLLWIPSGPGARGLAFMIDSLKSLNLKGLL